MSVPVPVPASVVLPTSFLYVPANKPDLFEKALDSDAEALILDLEDAVPMADKAAARAAVAAWFEAAPRPTAWVRINASSIADDLAALQQAQLGGVVLAKIDLDALHELDALLSPDVPVIGLVETGAALQQLAALAEVPRLVAFGIGEVDLLADLRITPGPTTAHVIDTLRSQVVVASAAAGLAAPVAPTSTDFRDLTAFADSTARLVELGFRSRTAVHPSQCAVINQVLTPSPDTIESARDVIDRFEQSTDGLALDARGRLIDAAVVRGAVETLTRVGSPSSQDL